MLQIPNYEASPNNARWNDKNHQSHNKELPAAWGSETWLAYDAVTGHPTTIPQESIRLFSVHPDERT